jgi:exopolysaccharide biosynthesis protein
MKKRFIFLIGLAVLSCFFWHFKSRAVTTLGEDLRIARQGGWKKLGQGLEYGILKVTRPSSESHLKIKIVRMSSKLYQPKVVYCKDYGLAPSDVKTLAEKAKAPVIINGGFFDEEREPLGLLIVDGKIRRRPDPEVFKSSGVFFFSGSPGIAIGREFSYEGVTQAVSCSPRLLVRGKFTTGVRNLERISRRSVVAIDGKKRILLLITDSLMEGLSFEELRRILKLDFLDLRDALCLDGGGSSQLYVRSGTSEESVMGLDAVPVGLAFSVARR